MRISAITTCIGQKIVTGYFPTPNVGVQVLIIGDSVSDGYIPFVARALNGTANAQHGPNNAGGGCADGAAYGAFCTKYFVRTPHFKLPPWDVITFNYGLHDGADTNASYTANLESIADQASHMHTQLLFSEGMQPNRSACSTFVHCPGSPVRVRCCPAVVSRTKMSSSGSWWQQPTSRVRPNRVTSSTFRRRFLVAPTPFPVSQYLRTIKGYSNSTRSPRCAPKPIV